MRTFWIFSIWLGFALSISWGIHYLVLTELTLQSISGLALSYVVNALMALSVAGFLMYFKERYFTQLGFLFMAGSLFKFLVFFLVFYPVYQQDGIMDRREFGLFFIPYVICLIAETITVSRMLNKKG